MSCNCKKNKQEVPEPTPIPKTVDEFINKELNRWNGGPQPEPTNENPFDNNPYQLIED